ncbi:MAG: ATP-binding protein [Nitrospirales bacterium]
MHSRDSANLEHEYRCQQALNQALLKTLSIGVCLMSESGEILSLNHAGVRMLGWSESSIVGKSAHDVFGCMAQESNHDTAFCPLARCIDSQTMIWVPRVELRTRHAEWCSVELSASSLQDVGGTGVMITFRDLSTEIQLRAESHQLASIPEESPFPIIEVDASGSLLYANPEMTSLMQEADIRSSGFSAAFPPHFTSLIQECLEENVIRRDLEVNVGQRQYAWLFSPHPELGLVRGFGLDISEQKMAANELAAFANQLECKNRELDSALIKAEAATKAKAEFLATMSHEIRTPLNGVIGMTEMLMDTPLSSEQVECTKLVKSSADGLLMIINDILDFSKIEAGKLNLEIISFRVQQLLEEVLDMFSERAHKKGLDLAGFVDFHIPNALQGDPNRLRQILTNFIGNAIKFTDQGEVFIEVAPMNRQVSDVSHSPSSVKIRFSVKDTGIGISPEAQERLFRAFSQADASTTRKYGGTGLGLAISRQLVELMGGELGVETNEGGGATFWCQIPFAIDQDYAAVPSEEYAFLRTQHVLCVGCPSATTRAMNNLFQRYEMQSAGTADCTEARTWLRQASKEPLPYTTVFVDSQISDTYLQNFIQAVKADPLLRNIKIIALVPFGGRTLDQRWKQNGVDMVLSKPVHQTQFLECFTLKSNSIREPSRVRETVMAERDCSSSRQLNPVGPRSQDNLGLSILVAEDNPVNQKVVSWILEKLGCHVTLVWNGHEAFNESALRTYDVILMDWQMPEMDGLEATRAIREREALAGKQYENGDERVRSHIPIVGMTANAMKGDRDECLDAGMDDYMAKPIRAHQLTEILNKWVPTLASGLGKPTKASDLFQHKAHIQQTEQDAELWKAENASKSHPNNMDGTYDVEAALRAVEGDWGLLNTLITIFLESSPSVMKQLQDAFHAGDYHRLQKHAHQLKGSLGTLHAQHAAAAVARLEKLSKLNDLDALKLGFIEFEEQYCRLLTLLQLHASGDSPLSLEKTIPSVSS